MFHVRDVIKLPEAQRAAFIAELSDDEADELVHDWPALARANQLTPADVPPWVTWLLLAGRGFGKTRTGAEWVRERVKKGTKILGLIAPTASDIRKVMIEGPAGLLAVCWEKDVDVNGDPMGLPIYEPSKTRVTWQNGAVAHLYSAEEPDRLRGPQHEALWCDELATWQDAEGAWDMAMFGLRLGDKPQVCVTTTPKPIPIIRELVADPTTVITRGTTYENRANLAATFFDKIVRKYEGTRLGRQELEAAILSEAEGALWSRDLIKNVPLPGYFATAAAYARTLARVVVAVDPPASSKGENALCGIVVSGSDFNGRGKVLADWSGRMKPGEWGAKVVQAYDEFGADRIVAEANQGGEMVAHTINTVRKNLPVTLVYASKGKQARAEPVQGLYEKGQVDHVGAFPELEDQMCTWEPLTGMASPDRLDALVWGLTHLQIGLGGSVLTTAEDRFVIEPDKAFRGGRIPSTWRRACALSLSTSTASAVWMVHDPVNDVLYLHDEYEAPRGSLAITAQAIRARGHWVPVLFSPKERKRPDKEGVRLAQAVDALGLPVQVTDADLEPALDMLRDRMETGRLKVLSTLSLWTQAVRGLRRDDDGEIVDENVGLILATALLVTWGLDVAITENRAASDESGYDPGAYQRNRNPSGY